MMNTRAKVVAAHRARAFFAKRGEATEALLTEKELADVIRAALEGEWPPRVAVTEFYGPERLTYGRGGHG